MNSTIVFRWEILVTWTSSLSNTTQRKWMAREDAMTKVGPATVTANNAQ